MATRRKAGPRPKKTAASKAKEKKIILKDYTEQESNEILEAYFLDSQLYSFKNHRKFRKLENTFRFTLSALSYQVLSRMHDDERIKNIYFHPSSAPPGGAMDGVSLRYRVYVEYNKKEEEE